METVIFLLVLIVLLPLLPLWRQFRVVRGQTDPVTGVSNEARVQAALRRHGITMTGHYLVTAGHGEYEHGHVYHWSGTDASGIQLSGTVEVGSLMREPVVTFSRQGAGQRAARALARQAALEGRDEAAEDPEELIRREVARRLDEIQSNRAAFLANDSNRDGVVDEGEWAEVRARLEAEVRAEHGRRSEDTQPVPVVSADDAGGW